MQNESETRAPSLLPLVVVLIVAVSLMVMLSGYFQHDEQIVPGEGTDVAEESAPLVGVDLQRLAVFEDHKSNMALEPFYYLLDVARQNSAKAMIRQARRDVSFGQLLDNPDKYRGELILLRGRLRRLREFDATTNEYGIRTQYEGWVFTPEARQLPYCVIAAHSSPDVAPAISMNRQVVVAGYFLGWWRHSTQDDRRTSSPVLMAHHFLATPAPKPLVDRDLMITIGPIITVAVVGLILYSFYRGRRPRPETQSTEGPVPDFDSFEISDAEPDEHPEP